MKAYINDIIFMDKISRAMFESLNDELFRSWMNFFQQVLRDSSMFENTL
jgi:molecular chaperone DnaK (HSP70)